MPANDSDDSAFIFENSGFPKGILDVIRASRAKYIEGSGLIKSGDLDKARETFNKSVDVVLQSDWDINSTPVLSRYFQDLIKRIQEDESRYLLAPCDNEEEGESAVVDELNDLDLFPVSIDSSLQDNLTADSGKSFPITMNDMVAKSLDYWLNNGRKYFVDGLLRSGQYRSIIERVFREESIPLDLMYLAQVESLFKPHAVSRAKAKGIWQFEKGTALAYGLKVTRDVDERSDPEKSTRAAARYLNDLFAMFKDWNLVLAAYNWGEGKVQRLIDSTGLKDFWQLADLRRRLPQETKNHVPLIQASVILARNPEKFGLPTELDPPLQYAEVSVSKPIDLRAAAKVLSTSIDELKKLNPALRGLTTPANYPNYQLKVPADSDPKIHEQLAALPTAKIKMIDDSGCRYKVQRGDTLARIASKYHVSVAELAKENGFSAKKKLVPGTWIQVPSRAAAPTKVAASKKNASGSPKLEGNKSKPGANKTAKTAVAKNKKKAGQSGINSSFLKNQLESKSAKQIASK
jgi:membrane-bound lytic murein transglycosylase D